jgi:hypothetical protein
VVAEERRRFGRSDWQGYLRHWLEKTTERQARDGGLAFPIAVGWARLGERQASLDWLERALDERSFRLTYLNADPIWDKVRSEPRFQAVARRMGLPRP